MNRLETFDIRSFSDRLNVLKEESTQMVCECPVCGGHRLTINKQSGAYRCWSGDCPTKDIREAIAPWDEIQGDQVNRCATTASRCKTSKLTSATTIPTTETISLAKLPTLADIPEKQRRLDSERGEVWEIQYPYSDTQWVQRTEWADPGKAKGRDKKTLPYHVTAEGEIKCGKGDKPWLPYRFNEVEKYGADKWVIFLEGEKCVEYGRWLGLASLTLQGGSWTEEAIALTMLQMKRADVAGVVYLPDHDAAGKKKAKKVAIAASLAGMPLLTFQPLALWENMPEAGDIADWIEWGESQGMERDDFIARLEEEIHAAAEARRQLPQSGDDSEPGDNISDSSSSDQRLRLDLQALLKESDPITKMRRRAEIASYYRLSKAEIEEALKELRQRNTTSEPAFFTLGDFLSQSEEPLDYIVPSMLPMGETVLLAAVPKAGKTLLAIDLAFAVATGEESFLGEQCKRGRVLIVSVDESASSTRSKLLKRGFRASDSDWVQVMTRFDVSQMQALEERLESFRPSLVIIDSLRRINHGGNISENSAEFADTIYTLKELLTKYSAAGVLIHHTSKDKDAQGVNKVRGSSAITGAVWGTWQIEHQLKPVGQGKNKKMVFDPKDPNRIFSVIARDTEGQQFKIELDPENNCWLNRGDEDSDGTAAAETQTMRQRIKSVLESNRHRQGLTVIEMRELLRLDPGDRSIYTALNRMVDKREIWQHTSDSDRRRMVYSLPKLGGDSPPPSMSVTDDDKYSKTYTQYGFQDSQQLVNNYSTISQHPVVDEPLLNNSNADTVSNSGVSQHFDEKGGREGVVAFQPDEDYCLNEDLAIAHPTPAQNMALVENDAIAPQLLQPSISVPNELFKVGDRVIWDDCPGFCASFNPFKITAIEGNCARLDFITNLVPLTDLRFE
jgi:KaiC/GvpD/RAD55 family RecA-like ATPase